MFGNTRQLGAFGLFAILLFSLPILAGNIAQSLNGSVNAVWVDQSLNDSQIVNTIGSALLGLVVGAVIVVVMTLTVHRKKAGSDAASH